jgi:hypothetical protein
MPLSFAVVVFAFVGLSPAFSWVPEIPFLGFVAAVVLIDLVGASIRAGRMTGFVRDGALAAALTGAIGGAVAGACYVIAGRSVANLVVLPMLGTLAGAVVGAAAAFVRR